MKKQPSPVPCRPRLRSRIQVIKKINVHQLINRITTNTTLSNQEAWWLLEHITAQSREKLLTTNEVLKTQIEQLDQILMQIYKDKKPLAYILGFVPFLGLKIKVVPPVLIPRPETEEWIEKAVAMLQPMQNQPLKILDIGTGSGCIALALAHHLPSAQITAIDINPQAIALARENAKINNISNVNFLLSDLFKNIDKDQDFDLIVSNPPYIDSKFLPQLEPQVSGWEDHGALFADNKGLQMITQILKDSALFLTKNKKLPTQLIIEIDFNQKDAVLKIAQDLGWNCHAVQDAFGQWRTVWCS
jgi:release factor glutamine methyltransferase